MSFTFAYRSRIVTSSLSDLVELGILTKPISEFTNDDIGTEVLIPYTDVGGLISGPIVFEVVGVNHHTSEEHQQTITLMTKNIIRYAAFDAKEPNNPDSNRSKFGNNRWSVSNIRQWLNSSGSANSWFTPQHEYDTAPYVTNVGNIFNVDGNNEAGSYADEPGFLAGFSADVLQHFTDITNTTFLCLSDAGLSNPSSRLPLDTTVDKVFLPSVCEMNTVSINGGRDGNHLSVRYPDNDSKIKQWNGVNDCYWTRSPYPNTTGLTVTIGATASVPPDDLSAGAYPYPFSGNIGIAPLVVLH